MHVHPACWIVQKPNFCVTVLLCSKPLMAFTNVVTQWGRLNVAPPLKLPSSRGNKLWPFSWHLGEPIHSQLPAAARRDFSPAIFKASHLFYFFLAKASVSFSPTVDNPPHFAGYFHRYRSTAVFESVFSMGMDSRAVRVPAGFLCTFSCRNMHGVFLTRHGFC